MSAHDMKPENWPLGPESKTGIGLTWNADSIGLLLGDHVSESTATNVDALSMVKLAVLPAPDDTLLLADLPHGRNNLKQLGRAVVGSPGEQLESLKGTGGIHGGRFNYLMADGHVELLSPLQTGSSGGVDVDEHRGIWTTRAGD